MLQFLTVYMYVLYVCTCLQMLPFITNEDDDEIGPLIKIVSTIQHMPCELPIALVFTTSVMHCMCNLAMSHVF